jgi:hypothetical protein
MILSVYSYVMIRSRCWSLRRRQACGIDNTIHTEKFNTCSFLFHCLVIQSKANKTLLFANVYHKLFSFVLLAVLKRKVEKNTYFVFFVRLLSHIHIVWRTISLRTHHQRIHWQHQEDYFITTRIHKKINIIYLSEFCFAVKYKFVISKYSHHSFIFRS